MARGEVIIHKGKKVVHIDLSNGILPDVKQAIEEAGQYIYNQPQGTVLCWVNTEGTKMTTEISDVLKSFTLKNKSYIKMTAISGVEGVQKVVISAIIMFTKRNNLVVKNSREEALDYLASIG